MKSLPFSCSTYSIVFLALDCYNRHVSFTSEETRSYIRTTAGRNLFSPPRESTDIGEALFYMGIRNNSPEIENQFVDAVGQLIGQQERVCRYFNIHPDDSRIPDMMLHLALTTLPHQNACFDIHPVHVVRDIASSHQHDVRGLVFRAPQKPFTADLIQHLSFTPPKPRDPEEPPVRNRHIVVVADGATMMMEKAYMEEVNPEMTRISTYSHEGRKVFAPDVLWRTALGKILGGSTIPTPEQFDAHPGLCQAVNDVIKAKPINYSLEPSQVMRAINDSLFSVMSRIFPSFKDDTVHLHPSGVMAIIAWNELMDGARNRMEYCASGDIGVSTDTSPRKSPYRHHVIGGVMAHDTIRTMTGLGMKAKPQEVAIVAKLKGPLTGNLPQPRRIFDIMLNDLANPPITSGVLIRERGKFGTVFSYTDGYSFAGEGSTHLTTRGRDRGLVGSDITAQGLQRDIWLSVYASAVNGLMTYDPYTIGQVGSILNPDARRSDDIAMVMIGGNLKQRDNFDRPVF